ncbi:hypothetical protein JYU34_001093 [Plutella xylostella]|uniref:Thyroglobulin type-1 domain-containing protein n=1 Tax=Plutella xylostella TaxID=51655 RepID=A0ABQ7R5Z4_PLUXY|nr:hypothetical protein JYU34_001093 [Plutella xylostella]
MAIRNYLFFVFLVNFCIFGELECQEATEKVLCEEGYCLRQIQAGACAATSPNCRFNNATGVALPSPTTCNCCDFCMPFIAENSPCSLGGPGEGTTIGRCADGLTCIDGMCQRMPASLSECHKRQDEFDQRQLDGEGGWLEERPACDGKGRFAPYVCVPTQTCFCQDEDGQRLFGEVLHSSRVTPQTMPCECSRRLHRLKASIDPGVRFPVDGPRCTADGNFYPVQCVGQICHCANKLTGVLEGKSVNVTEDKVSDLPCYDKDLDLFAAYNFDNFSSPCLEEKREKVALLQASIDQGYTVDYYNDVSDCHPDGTYGRVVVNNGTKICLDEWGKQIGHYQALPNTPEYDNMNCNCAVTSSIMAASLEQPVCCSNGNFRAVQCRRGRCRCVDQHGRQTETETYDVASLSCATEGWETC